MTEKDAQKIKLELEKFCRERGLWVETREVRKPELRDIVLTISLKVKEK